MSTPPSMSRPSLFAELPAGTEFGTFVHSVLEAADFAATDLAGEIAAHVATATTLSNWIHAARRILKSRGMLTLIWRADGIAEVLAALDHGFGSLEILPVHGDVKAPANRVLIRATKGGRAPTQIHAGLMLNDESGVPNQAVQEILTGKGSLPLAAP